MTWSHRDWDYAVRPGTDDSGNEDEQRSECLKMMHFQKRASILLPGPLACCQGVFWPLMDDLCEVKADRTVPLAWESVESRREEFERIRTELFDGIVEVERRVCWLCAWRFGSC